MVMWFLSLVNTGHDIGSFAGVVGVHAIDVNAVGAISMVGNSGYHHNPVNDFVSLVVLVHHWTIIVLPVHYRCLLIYFSWWVCKKGSIPVSEAFVYYPEEYSSHRSPDIKKGGANQIMFWRYGP